MKAIRTRYYKMTMCGVSIFCALYLTVFAILTRKLCPAGGIDGAAAALFCLIALATMSFLLFCFQPFFKGDRRWFSVSGVLTVSFFIGSMVLFQTPITA